MLASWVLAFFRGVGSAAGSFGDFGTGEGGDTPGWVGGGGCSGGGEVGVCIIDRVLACASCWMGLEIVCVPSLRCGLCFCADDTRHWALVEKGKKWRMVDGRGSPSGRRKGIKCAAADGIAAVLNERWW